MSNLLSEVHPELISEWSDKNLPLTSDKITFGSNKKVWWKGACGHESRHISRTTQVSGTSRENPTTEPM